MLSIDGSNFAPERMSNVGHSRAVIGAVPIHVNWPPTVSHTTWPRPQASFVLGARVTCATMCSTTCSVPSLLNEEGLVA